MDEKDFKTDFLEDVKSANAATGEGACASFVSCTAEYLMQAEVLSDFTPCFYKGRLGRNNYRVDGYVYDDFDHAMTLAIADYDGNDFDRTLKNADASQNFKWLTGFLDAALTSDLYRTIEISTPCADLVDFLKEHETEIRKYRLMIFTDADMSSAIKTVDLDDYHGVPMEGQIWDIGRIYRVCGSEQGRQMIEIDFTQYVKEGIPCLKAQSAGSKNQEKEYQYESYLGVIPGSVLADIYDQYGSKLLEGNVRSFLSTKVAVNKKIRATILNEPQMFFAYNNGIAATAMEVRVKDTDHGSFITYAGDFQIINGGQTTASISNARYKDKAALGDLYVQMKLTAIGETGQDAANELIENISRSSNSQNKVSDADFFASHPFHRRMEQISRRLYAPAVGGAQYETKWFYERARGQYLQEQMRLTPAKKNQFQKLQPKNQVITKTDLAKVWNCWMGNPDVVSKGAQTNFNAFAEYIENEWGDEKTGRQAQFNERYYQKSVALMLIFHYLESEITVKKQPWYHGGYRANIIYYTVALFHRLVQQQFAGYDLDLILIWNRQSVPDLIGNTLLALAEIVLETITNTPLASANVTQWCKRRACWEEVQEIKFVLPEKLQNDLISNEEEKRNDSTAKKVQKIDNGIQMQTDIFKYPVEMWKGLYDFSLSHHLVSPNDVTALRAACSIPNKIPTPAQSKRILDILPKAIEEGFSIEQSS